MNNRLLKVAALAALILAGLVPFAKARRRASFAQEPGRPLPTQLASTDYLARAPARASEKALAPSTTQALVAAQSARPSLTLGDRRTIRTNFVGDSSAAGPLQDNQAQPLTLASADFDGDGVPDLVSGFRTGKGGIITVHRGNIDALWPYGAALRNEPPPAFLPDARTIALPEAPDFLVAGDFDADGHADVIAAQRGSSAIYFLRGDGHGGFLAPQRIPLAGNVTAMTSGDMNRSTGLPDLIVAVRTANGATALVFESPSGAIKAQPETFALPQPATGLALGRFDGGAMRDLAIAVGDQLIVVHGRDRKLSLDAVHRAAVPPARVSQQGFPFAIQAITAGDFTGAGPSLAALGDDGTIHILEHALGPGSLMARAINEPYFQPTMRVAGRGPDGQSVAVSGLMTPGREARLAALRQAARARTNSGEWTERGSLPLPAGFAEAAPRLVTARVSGSLEDVLLPDSRTNQVHVFTNVSRARTAAGAKVSRTSPAPPQASLELIASLPADGAPAAVLPMRLNQYGLHGLVMLQAGQAEPVVMQQDPPPTNIFTVTNTLDISAPGSTTIPAGSLRQAITDANNAFSNNNNMGTCSIVFDIPTTDPNYNPATGVFLIRPLSTNVPASMNQFALPPINATVTIDGYTQPGASPNTLANGDNAKILIQIDGSLTTTPGGSGLIPFDDEGSTFRGMAFTGWTNGLITNGNESGAVGIEANGIGDFVEGNFFGTVDGTTASPNRIGVFAENGTVGGTVGGNVVGGTTPQARNILSGNQLGGALFLLTALEGKLEGNFVGVDITGATPLPNGSGGFGDGTNLNGSTVTIGGVLPGTGNVIAGNLVNVDINDLLLEGAASNSTVQGNLIGTDATGTLNVGGDLGVSISTNVTDMLIGGTTPAARNVISGNNCGVYIVNSSFSNVVQGNYIGVDVSGGKALSNSSQGIFSGLTTGNVPAAETTIGGSAPGAGNVISGNAADGIEISGTTGSPLEGNVIQGNFIGTDATGTNAVPNQGNGIFLTAGATNNLIGSTEPGSGNLIAYNAGDGVLIDPGAPSGGQGLANNTIANTILSNGGTGVRIKTGANNRISQNSIFRNGALGIDLDVAGPNPNTHCNSSNTGANNLQNAPVLTVGSGPASISQNGPDETVGSGAPFITATATDPNGNTSEFSNAVAASISGNILTLLGNFDSTPNTTFTIEFFSSTAADPSGFGQGQTYLGSTTVTTPASCTVAVNNPVDLTQADMSVVLTDNISGFALGPDFGAQIFTGTVTNNGPATAHNVVFTDALPAALQVSGSYCNLGSCQSPVTTTLGACTVANNTVTCNMGTMAPGATATVAIPVQTLSVGSITNTATVAATEPDPNLANNTSSATVNATYPFPFIDHFNPAAVLAGSSDLPLTIYGVGFISASTVTFNGNPLTVTGLLSNQLCGNAFAPTFCSALQVVVPNALLTTAGTPNVTVTNPDPGPGGANSPSSLAFTIASSCSFTVFSEFPSLPGTVENTGTDLIPESVSVTPNVPTCSWTASSTVPWTVLVDTTSTDINGRVTTQDSPASTGSGEADFAVAPNTDPANPRTGSVTVAGQSFMFQQDPGATCDFTFGSPSATLAATGGPENIVVTATSSSCSYFVESFEPWVTIPQSSGLLVGSATANFTVAANPGPPRTAAILVGGEVFTLMQDAPSCYFTLNSSFALFPVVGGTGSIGVIASSPSCAWTAAPSDPSVSIASGASGTGNGTVNFSVAANAGGPQTFTIAIGNATASATYTVQQDSAFTCSFTLGPASAQVTSNGISNSFVVTASYDFCNWTAVSNDPAPLTITQNSSGTGNGAVYYVVAQNTAGPRTLTITAGCQTFTVNQDAVASASPPAITSLQPSSATAGAAAFSLTVNGMNFVNGTVVSFNSNARTTTFVNSGQLTAAILASDIATAGMFGVTVTNPAGGGTSAPSNFTVNNPVAAITSLQPATATAGGAAFTLTVNGTNFVNGAVVSFNGNARTTTFVNSGQLTAAILASDITTAGTPAVIVTNPGPGGGASNSSNFTVNNPVPTITSLQPATATAGGAAFTLTVNGTSFVNGAVVNFNGQAKATTFVSAAQLTAQITANDIAAAGTPPVTVTNPAPGGGTSSATAFAITDFSIVNTSGALTEPAGTPAVYTLSVSGIDGTFPGAVNLSVSGLPPATRAAFQPGSVSPGASSVTSQLTLTSTARGIAGQAPDTPPGAPKAPFLLACFSLIGFFGAAAFWLAKTGRLAGRVATAAVFTALLLGGVGLLAGCHGGFPASSTVPPALSTPKGAYTVTVTGTSGSTSHSITIGFTVE